MSGLPKFFQQTSDGLYDRHHYRLVLSDGSSKTFDNWLDVHHSWFRLPNQFLSHIDVLDAPAKGFK